MTIERKCDVGLVLTIVAIVALMLSGCSSVPAPTSQLKPPSARLMAAPEPLADVSTGDDLYQDDARCSARYGAEAGKLRSLQSYVRIITKK